MTSPLQAGNKPKKTFIPRLAYGSVSVGLSVIPLLSVACGDSGSDAIIPALYDDSCGSYAGCPDAGSDAETPDAADAADAVDTADGG